MTGYNLVSRKAAKPQRETKTGFNQNIIQVSGFYPNAYRFWPFFVSQRLKRSGREIKMSAVIGDGNGRAEIKKKFEEILAFAEMYDVVEWHW